MRRVLLSFAFGLLAAPAFAQGTEANPEAAPGSIAIGLIEHAGAEGIFELVHDGQVTVRHARSGMVCHFLRDGSGARLIVFAPPAAATPVNAEPAIPRGDDVACDNTEGGVQMRLFATRYPFGSTLEEQITGVETAIRRRDPRAERYAGDAVRNTEDGLPVRRSTRFIVTHDGIRTFTRASVARVGDWILKLRYTTAAADDAAAAQADHAADLIFDGALSEIINAH